MKNKINDVVLKCKSQRTHYKGSFSSREKGLFCVQNTLFRHYKNNYSQNLKWKIYLETLRTKFGNTFGINQCSKLNCEQYFVNKRTAQLGLKVLIDH